VGGALRAASYFPLADAQGNVAALVDADPADEHASGLFETSEYEPFGRVLARQCADAEHVPAARPSCCPFGFGTKYTDPVTGLVDFGYRHYRPDLGRWLSRDPLAEAGGPNLYAYCHNDPINHIDPLGARAYGSDYSGQLDWTDWRETNYTQADVEQIYAVLAQRDRHIYNTGLANVRDVRERNVAWLERILGVPVTLVNNATLVEPGYQLGKLGSYIGHHGWTWNPVKMAGNLVGTAVEIVAKPLAVAGNIADFPIAGFDKIPIPKIDPALYSTQAAFDAALAHVMSQNNSAARVYSWMHSEGAIHASRIMNTLSPDEYRWIQGYTFGAGTYLFKDKRRIQNFGTRNTMLVFTPLLNWRVRDPVPLFAGMDIVRNSSDITWVDSDRFYTHGFPTYAEAVMVDLSKKYFAENAKAMLGR
jgi:RHS repeat-associated protein